MLLLPPWVDTVNLSIVKAVPYRNQQNRWYEKEEKKEVHNFTRIYLFDYSLFDKLKYHFVLVQTFKRLYLPVHLTNTYIYQTNDYYSQSTMYQSVGKLVA